MTILLTGATGYLGSELLRFWVNKGHRLIILKRSSSSLLRISDLLDQCTSYDVDNPYWEKVLLDNQVEVVVHVAASYGRKGESLTEIVESNTLFPIRLLNLALQTGVRYFINTASSLPPTISDYSLSKSHFQDWLNQKKDQIHSVNLVLEYFYGPRDENWKFISMVVNNLKENDPAINFTSGLQKRDFIYISDVVSAFDVVLDKIGELKSGTDIPVGTGVSYSIKEVVEYCKVILKNSTTQLNFGAIPERGGELAELVADPSILKELGWFNQHSLNSGIIELVKNS